MAHKCSGLLIDLQQATGIVTWTDMILTQAPMHGLILLQVQKTGILIIPLELLQMNTCQFY